MAPNDPQDPNEFDEDKLAAADETGDSEGKSDGRSGKGKSGRTDDGTGTGITTARFSAEGGIRLPPNKLKEVMSNWEYLDVAKAMMRVAEFFSELPARASAHAVVTFSKSQGYAIINHAVSFGTEVAQLLRERTAGNIKRLRTKFGIKVVARATTTGPSAGPGMA